MNANETKTKQKTVTAKKPTAWKSRKLFGFNDAPGFECVTDLNGGKQVLLCSARTTKPTDAKGLRTLAEKLTQAAAWLETK